MAAISDDSIYLDHNATTPVFPEVIEAMRACWSEPYLNPASQHDFGRRARRVLEDVRDRIGELLGAGSHDRVIFTSGGTESNNLAIRGLLPPRSSAGGLSEGELSPHLVTSSIEHPSISTLAAHLSSSGYKVETLPVDRNGVTHPTALPALLRPETRLVAAMLANNETGVVQPIAAVAEICRSLNIPLHTDAAQAAGKLPINFADLGVATMTIAAHKFGGPLGIGALLIRHDIEMTPLLHGGVQQSSLRPGTESVALGVGMVTALEQWHKNRGDWLARLQSLREDFETSLRHHLPEIEIVGEQADRLPNTSNVAFIG